MDRRSRLGGAGTRQRHESGGAGALSLDPDADLAARIRRVCGPARLGEPAAVPREGAEVWHVVAVARSAPGRLRALRITDATPKCDDDRFLLDCVRARSDVSLTTGSILRAEPELELEIADSELRARYARPRALVLSRGRDLPLDHPLLAGDAIVFVPEDAAAALRADLAARGSAARVVGAAAAGPREALAWLAGEWPGLRVALEAGPSVAALLYEAPRVIDAVLQSVFEGPLPAELLVGELPDPAAHGFVEVHRQRSATPGWTQVRYAPEAPDAPEA